MDIRDAFFDEVYRLAASHRDFLFISADTDAFGLKRCRRDFPKQFLDAGSAEQNLVSVAGGVALSGIRVFIFAIIPFITMRCYEQIKADVCSMNLPVTLVGLGPGLSFNYDGPTHHGMQDLSVMRALPQMTILNPCDAQSAMACARTAYSIGAPCYVRVDKGEFRDLYRPGDDFGEGLKIIKKASDVNIISTGFMSHTACEASEELKKLGFEVGVIDVLRLKPLNSKALLEVISRSKRIISLEEHSVIGGLGTAISELMTDNGITVGLNRMALADTQYFENGSRSYLHSLYGIDTASVVKRLLPLCRGG